MSRPGPTESGGNASYELPSKHHHIQVQPHHKSSSPSVARKKAPLQVHWHPSVNQHQQSKRTRHILSVLAVLAFFTSITFVLYHYSGCDITSGKCHRFPRHHQKGGLHLQGLPKASKLRPMILGESSVTIEEPGREQEKTKAAHPWSLLYGDPKIEWARTGKSKDATNDDIDTNDHSNDHSNDHLVKAPSEEAQQGNRNEDAKDQDKVDPIDPIDEDPVFDVEPEDTEEGDETGEYEDEDAESATPQQAYAGIWSEPEALTEDDYLELEEDYQAMAQPGQTFASRLDQVSQEEMVRQAGLQTSGDDATPPEVKYMTYLPAEGLTNQFLGMLRAIMVAKSLGRTLVLPPITSSRHNQGKHNQPWSSFFDLPTFAYLTGVKMIEIKDLRDPELDSTKVEPLECHVAFGVGSLRALDDTAKEFLEQWKLEFRSVSASSRPLFEVETSEFDDMVSLLRSEEHERLLCLTNVNKIEVPANTEWNLYGQYFYFSPRTENLFERLFLRLQRSRPVSRQPRLAPTYDNENNVHHDFGASLETDRTTLVPKGRARPATSTQDDTTPFIVIHIRRQDFIEYCQIRFQHQLQQCLPTAQDLVERLQEVLADRADLRGVPVYVVTDEERTQKLAEMRAMGWQIVNHARLGTITALGPFGPPVMDQMLMTKAQIVIGVRPSAFFRVAAHRQRDWSGRQAVSV